MLKKIAIILNVVLTAITCFLLAKMMYSGGYALDENWTYPQFFDKHIVDIWVTLIFSFISVLLSILIGITKK